MLNRLNGAISHVPIELKRSRFHACGTPQPPSTTALLLPGATPAAAAPNAFVCNVACGGGASTMALLVKRLARVGLTHPLSEDSMRRPSVGRALGALTTTLRKVSRTFARSSSSPSTPGMISTSPSRVTGVLLPPIPPQPVFDVALVDPTLYIALKNYTAQTAQYLSVVRGDRVVVTEDDIGEEFLHARHSVSGKVGPFSFM